MEFGQYIRDLRKKKNLSARELSRRTGISQAYLSQLETGKHNNPTRQVLEKLAAALDIDYYDLVAKVDGIQVITDKRMKKIFESYASITEEKGDDIHGNIQYRIEKLFSDETTLTYNHRPLNKEDKQKILSIIETILK